MFLQILPADKVSTVQLVFENQLVFVILGLAISVFTILKITKFLSQLRFTL
ncbi:hypothetical protein [Polaribacter sp. SA4-10]|uniref:hypothetical protein n=1 Tax=Polaribacter sp. SA4-10 TaxID=754397 RepID=UPI0012F8D65D|nr:hypothetical protein [Polaribacter sp. SA4-10]